MTGYALCVMRQQMVASDSTSLIQTLLLTDNRGVMKPEFLARMAQLAKEDFSNLHQALQTQLHEVTNDSEIEDAYFTIAKNRLASALLPLLEEKEQNAVATIARRWMDNEITEQLITLHQGGERLCVPGMVALIEPVGGMLISLSNGRIYLWNPDDTSVALCSFLHGHLSPRQKLKVAGMPLTVTVDLPTCQILPPLSFSESHDIWRALIQLDYHKMSEYLHDYAQLQRQGHYQQPPPVDPHHPPSRF
ncbi:hypothetical protein SODG_001349 [Sodalis praecaptivus]